jgi:hypothetical protein
MPLHFQNPDVKKAAKQNPSYESFRPNIIHPSGQYREMEDRAGIVPNYRIRRYPNGLLDYRYVVNQILECIRRLEVGADSGDHNIGSGALLPIEAALLTVILPEKYRKTEPMQAEILTQLSDTEKEKIRAIVVHELMDIANWNAGRGGGVPGTMPNNTGIG